MTSTFNEEELPRPVSEGTDQDTETDEILFEDEDDENFDEEEEMDEEEDDDAEADDETDEE